jgi:hypothetical protein
MASFNKFDSFCEELGKGSHQLHSHVFKAVLTNTAPVSTNTVLSNITQIANSGGYVGGAGGGVLLDSVVWARSGATSKLTIADEVITATGGSIGPFRYAVVYNDTSATDLLVCWYDYGSSITLADTEPFTLDFDASAGVFTLA